MATPCHTNESVHVLVPVSTPRYGSTSFSLSNVCNHITGCYSITIRGFQTDHKLHHLVR